MSISKRIFWLAFFPVVILLYVITGLALVKWSVYLLIGVYTAFVVVMITLAIAGMMKRRHLVEAEIRKKVTANMVLLSVAIGVMNTLLLLTCVNSGSAIVYALTCLAFHVARLWILSRN